MSDALRPAEKQLIDKLREWAIRYGRREIRLFVDYQDAIIAQIIVTANAVKEERFR